MASGSERLVSSDVGKRCCDCDYSILSFREPEARQEKLESAVLIEDRMLLKKANSFVSRGFTFCGKKPDSVILSADFARRIPPSLLI